MCNVYVRSWLVCVLVFVHVILVSPMMMTGGLSEQKDATRDVQHICDQIKAQLGKEIDSSLTELTALSYRSQVVAGTNYFIKARDENGNYYHLRVFQPLPNIDEPVHLAAYQTNKRKQDPITYF